MELTRKGFVAGSAAAAVAVGAGIALEARADETTAQTADLVIVGEGMGGLTAGVRALENGIKNVTIVEVSTWPGGGSSFSNGSIHAFGMGSTEELFKLNTRHASTSDIEIKSFLAIADLLHWVDTLGLPIEVVDPADHQTIGDSTDADLPSGQMISADGQYGATAPINFFRAYEQLFIDNGGTVLHRVEAMKLVTTETGEITGITCRNVEDGSRFVINTSQVILSCGGWQNDQQMKSAHLGRDAWQAGCMGVPYNMASGIAIAAPVDPALTGDFSNFAGLFLPSMPAKNLMEDVELYENNDYTYEENGKWWVWREIIDNFPAHSILVNNDGKRFADEARYRHSADTDIAAQPHATAIVVCDDPAYQNWLNGVVRGMPEGEGMAEKIEFICSERIGGAVFEANTLEELADAMNATNVTNYQLHKATFLKTVEEYNAAAEAGTAADLDPERVVNEATPIVEPPFHAIPIRNAIFTVYGGLAIDEQSRVLDRCSAVIPGLYATSPCAGGVIHEFYAGAIAHAGVTGIWAADAAAAALNG